MHRKRWSTVCPFREYCTIKHMYTNDLWRYTTPTPSSSKVLSPLHPTRTADIMYFDSTTECHLWLPLAKDTLYTTFPSVFTAVSFPLESNVAANCTVLYVNQSTIDEAHFKADHTYIHTYIHIYIHTYIQQLVTSSKQFHYQSSPCINLLCNLC